MKVETNIWIYIPWTGYIRFAKKFLTPRGKRRIPYKVLWLKSKVRLAFKTRGPKEVSYIFFLG